MLKHLLSKLDPKYTKICAYASVTVLITVILLVLLQVSGGFWNKLWILFTAVLRPVVIGFIFSYLLQPVVNKIEHKLKHDFGMRKTARVIAVVIGIILFLAVITAFISVVAIMFYKSFSIMKFGGLKAFFAYAEHDLMKFIEIAQRKLADFGLSISTIRTIVSTVANAVANLGSGLVFGVIFAVYFLLDKNSISRYWSRAYHLLAGHKAEAQFKQFCEDADKVFSGYIRGQFIDATIMGVMTSLVLSLTGIPSAVIIGILTGFGNLIPYVGPVVGYVTLALVCLSTGAYVKFAIGAVCLALILFVDGNIVNPKLLSNSIKIHPLLVIAALIGGGAIGGFIGMIVAVPTAALIKVQFDRYLESREHALQAIQEAATTTENIAKEAGKNAIAQKTDAGNKRRRRRKPASNTTPANDMKSVQPAAQKPKKSNQNNTKPNKVPKEKKNADQ